MRNIVCFSTSCYYDFTSYYLHRVGQEPFQITSYQHNILEELTKKNEPVTRAVLESCNKSRDRNDLTTARSADTQISILRSYDGSIEKQIIAVRGVGYRYIGELCREVPDEETPPWHVIEVEVQTGTANSAGKREELSTPEEIAGTSDGRAEAKEHKKYDTQMPVGPSASAALCELMCEFFEKSLEEMVQAKTAEETIGLIKGLNEHYLVIGNDMLERILQIVTTYELQVGLDKIGVLDEVRTFIFELFYRLNIRALEAEINEKKNDLERARTALDEENVNRIQNKIKGLEMRIEEFETDLASLKSRGPAKKQ